MRPPGVEYREANHGHGRLRAERGGWAARFVVLVCLVATLWLGMGPSAGRLPGLSRVMEWAETAVASLR